MTLATFLFGLAMGCVGFIIGLWTGGPMMTEEDIRRVLEKYAHDHPNTPLA